MTDTTPLMCIGFSNGCHCEGCMGSERIANRAPDTQVAPSSPPREPTRAMLDAIEELPQVRCVNDVLGLHQIRTGATLDVLDEPTLAVAMWRAMWDGWHINEGRKANKAGAASSGAEAPVPTQGESAEYLAPSPQVAPDSLVALRDENELLRSFHTEQVNRIEQLQREAADSKAAALVYAKGIDDTRSAYEARLERVTQAARERDEQVLDLCARLDVSGEKANLKDPEGALDYFTTVSMNIGCARVVICRDNDAAITYYGARYDAYKTDDAIRTEKDS